MTATCLERRQLLIATAALGVGGVGGLAQAAPDAPRPPTTTGWPAWSRFAQAYVREDGRVVDWTDRARSTSEGQSYGLFFALVAGDRPRFERILDWTRDNLAGGDLGARLPAWHWGRDEDPLEPRWGVLDPNSASDADLWIAYALLEAGRLWRDAGWDVEARALLARIAREEVRQVGPLTVLMPGKSGFIDASGHRLNPSYTPPFLLKRLGVLDPKGPWHAVLDSQLRLLPQLAPGGRIPDWYVLTDRGPRLDAESDGRGSYDAIRNYLWAGLGPKNMPESARTLAALRPFVALLNGIGRTPEIWYPDGRAPVGIAPPGFDAALLPFLNACGETALADARRRRLARDRTGGLLGQPARYYDQVLALFGEGHDERRFRFGPDGRLELS